MQMYIEHYISLRHIVCLYFACSFLHARCYSSRNCDAYISRPPWPTDHVFVPQNSTLVVDCATDSNKAARFIIDIPGVANDLQFTDPPQESILEGRGLFQLDSDDFNQSMKRLLINNTERNNQTVIECNFLLGETHQFTLFTYEPRPVMLTYDSEVNSLKENALNISWSRDSTFSDTTRMYNLTVTSDGKIIDTIVDLTETHYYFSIPDASSSCQIYNFGISVTATLVGANHTGDGCSVLSPPLSKMLPSLPYIATLATSLNHTLESQLGAGFQLKVLVMPANYCAEYPVTDYVLEVEGPTPSSMSITPGSISTVDNLLENEMYSFHIIVSNSVGNVSTNRTTIYTTDVKNVAAMSIEDSLFIVKCVFVTGSTARGCMVVLVGLSDNKTMNLTRGGLCATGVISTILSISGVIGYDIESDGTLGTLAIEGGFSNESLSCTENVTGDKLDIALVVAVAMAVSGAVLVIAISIVIIICLHRKHKKSGYAVKAPESEAHSSVNITAKETADVNKEELDHDQAVPLYDLPAHKQTVGVRTAGDGEDHGTGRYDNTTHARGSPEKEADTNKDTCTTTYAELNEDKHFYFTLESSRPPQGVKVPPPADDILPDKDAPPLPPPFVPDQESQAPPLPPVYQDISCLTSKEAVINGIGT